MAVTSRVSTLVVRSCLSLLLAVGAAACSIHRINLDMDRQLNMDRQTCLSEGGAVRTCLVPDKGDGLVTRNIPIGNTGCYWFRLIKEPDEDTKEKQYRRVASGRPSQFSFAVVNHCTAPVDVRFDIAETGTLVFLPGRCDAGPVPSDDALKYVKPDPRQKVAFREMHRATLAPNGGATAVQCDAFPYPKNLFGPTRQRTFNLVATGYDGKAIDPVEYDPEVDLEKAGNPP